MWKDFYGMGEKDYFGRKIMKQIIFCDIENKTEHGGILLDDGDIVCGCCGGLIPQNEIENACDGEGKEILSELGITYDIEF